MTPPHITTLPLGRTTYTDALAIQRRIHERRKAADCGDALILTEHEPVLTLGRGADRQHIRADAATLARRGIEVVPVERGGDVTYHGPGQLVAYPILDLTAYGRDIRAYVRALEESAIRLLAGYGVSGERHAGTPGVWVGEAKIASVGVFISRWVTLHGIAINIDPDLSHFDLIDPCGLVGMRMTSLTEILGRNVTTSEAEEQYVEVFRAVMAVVAAHRTQPKGVTGPQNPSVPRR
ncbi:MAG: lipoyl(octanoyl) transferase LipB [Dehalococcoidia bacterium]